MAKRPKRQKAIKRLNLSDHTLDINIRRCNYNKFSFSEIEDYVHDLVGSRDYEYDAIKQIMIYLWGGSYKSISELGRENYKQKLQIQQRFGTEENFLRQLPLPERLSGVVHMVTGTGILCDICYCLAFSWVRKGLFCGICCKKYRLI
jgi:hypothetical protein